MALKKAAERKVDGQSTVPLMGGKFALDYPGIWDHLTQTAWEDGSPRVPSSILIFEQDGSLKLMLRDKSAGLCLWVAGRTFEALLLACEMGINDPATEWRQDRQNGGGPAKRTKRTGS